MDETNIVEGFEVRDRDFLDGVVRGLEYAERFIGEDGDLEGLDYFKETLKRQAEWLF